MGRERAAQACASCAVGTLISAVMITERKHPSSLGPSKTATALMMDAVGDCSNARKGRVQAGGSGESMPTVGAATATVVAATEPHVVCGEGEGGNGGGGPVAPADLEARDLEAGRWRRRRWRRRRRR